VAERALSFISIPYRYFPLIEYGKYIKFPLICKLPGGFAVLKKVRKTMRIFFYLDRLYRPRLTIEAFFDGNKKTYAEAVNDDNHKNITNNT
jgi:hypothetical protein